MTFDLTDWWPVRMVGGLDWRVGTHSFLGAAIAVTFHLVKAVKQCGIAWVRNHHVVVSVLTPCVVRYMTDFCSLAG